MMATSYMIRCIAFRPAWSLGSRWCVSHRSVGHWAVTTWCSARSMKGNSGRLLIWPTWTRSNTTPTRVASRQGRCQIRRFCDGTVATSDSVLPASVGRVGRLNHVAIACASVAEASRLYRDVLGASVSEPQQLSAHGVTCVFVRLPGGSQLELLEPLGSASPIAGYLARHPSGGIHHVCLEVDDLAAALEKVAAAGVRCLGARPQLGAHNKPVMFLHPKDCGGVLVELEQA